MRSKPHIFAGNPLDRAPHLRNDKDLLSALLIHEDSRILPIWKLNILVNPGLKSHLSWKKVAEINKSVDIDDVVFLGLEGSVGRFAINLDTEINPCDDGSLDGSGVFREIRALASDLPEIDTPIAAQARAIIGWNTRNRFCAQCGSPTKTARGGYLRQCVNKDCGVRHFPRVDPVVIMMVVNNDTALLGRQSFWKPGMYSTLAGFIDPGESVEEAVRREVLEETGVVVGDVIYHSSQPWPFPSSLMIGCISNALSTQLNVDTTEVEAAAWFTRYEVKTGIRRILEGQPEDGSFHLPFEHSIAHQLAAWWVANG